MNSLSLFWNSYTILKVLWTTGILGFWNLLAQCNIKNALFQVEVQNLHAFSSGIDKYVVHD